MEPCVREVLSPTRLPVKLNSSHAATILEVSSSRGKADPSLPAEYQRTPSVTVLLGTPLWNKTRGTSSPGCASGGIVTFT